MDNNVLNHLIEKINKSEKLKVEYGITGQEIKYDEDNRLNTFSSNTTMEVNYKEKTATRETVRSDFKGTIKIIETYKENKKISSNSNEDKIFSTIEYENLFKPGGILYPVYLQELIPVESQMNNKNCQVCIPSEKIIKDIKNYIKSTYAIYEKSENEGAAAPVSFISPLGHTVCHPALYCLSKKQHKDYRLRQGTGHL